MGKLAVFFPGIGYTCDMPLLNYARKIAGEKGYTEQICLTYSSELRNIRGDKEKMHQVFTELYAQAKEKLSAVNWAEYEDILFIGKSVGTAIASAYAQKYAIPCRLILYTPLEATYRFEPKRAIAFTGDADPWVVHEDLIRCSREAGVPMDVFHDANHSLETSDTMQNIDNLRDIMRKTEAFIAFA